jgi:protein ImuB
MRLFAPKLEEIAPGLGIELMHLKASEVEALPAGQLGFESADPLSSATPEVCLASLIDRLANRLGSARVLRLVSYESHLPERATRMVPALTAANIVSTWPAGRPRPIRLLTPPDPIEVMAPVPDDPPLSFRWRRVTHRVRHAEGPERIAAEWWLNPAAAGDDDIRDYYRVEDETGRRFWLYRHGLYRPETVTRWFLHGFFP